MFSQFMNSFSYTKLGNTKSPIRKNKLVLFLLVVLAIVTLSTTFAYTKFDFETTNSYQNEEEHSKVIDNQQTNHRDKRTIIFPNDFPKSDAKLAEYYVEELEEALDPEDLIFRNRFTYKLPNDLSFSQQEFELFSANSDSASEDKCDEFQTKMPVEASPAYNKNADMRKVLTRFMMENSPYYNELKPCFPNLKKELDEDTIDKHWYQLIGSTVWLKQYGVHMMVSRIVYTVKDQGTVQFSLTYLQVFDRNWKELDNVELIVPQEDGSYKPILYPQFAQVPVYHNPNQISRRYYGVEDPRIQVITSPSGYEEPIILYNSHHRKIASTDFENDGEGTVKFNSYRSIFMGWLWKTQKGKSNLEEMPINDDQVNNMEYIKVKEILRPNRKRKGTEKNWAMFFNYKDKLEYGYDHFIYFVYQFKNLKVLKCKIYEDEPCSWEFQQDDYMGAGSMHGGSELININQIILESNSPKLEALLDRFPEGREIWIGFARAMMKGCGCGPKMYRPNLVVLMKDQENYKFAYISSFAGLGIEILPWHEGKGLCSGTNLIIPNGISAWSIEKDEEDDSLTDYLAFTISRRDATVDVVYVKGILNGLLFDDPHPKLLNTNQEGFHTNTPVTCALNGSDKFCKIYGANVKAFEEANKPKEEEKKD